VGSRSRGAEGGEGKILFSCVNCLKPDFSGLEVGTSTSAAEEIVKLVPGARVVEAIPPMAQILAADSRRLDEQQISAFYCGNDPCCTTWTSIRSMPVR
jgi:predicted dinucleotide-binding enzyme